MLNNGLMTYKNKWLSFINKKMIPLLCLLMIVIVPCSYFLFAYWSEMPILLKVFGPIIFAIVFIGVIITPLNGMIITKKGTIIFLPDFRLKILNINNLEKISIVFSQWDNNKFSAMVVFVFKNGKVFTKDYSKQFRNIKNKKLLMSMYTISKRKVDKLCKKLLDMNICDITILDKNMNITYQRKI